MAMVTNMISQLQESFIHKMASRWEDGAVRHEECRIY